MNSSIQETRSKNNYDISLVVKEFDWVIKNLESIDHQNQIPSIENLFNSWQKKYSCERLDNIISDLQFYFRKKLERKEKKLCKV